MAKEVVQGACVVCGSSDARALVQAKLAGGARVTLCGSHDLVLRRSGGEAKSAADVRAICGERRGGDRRGGEGLGEVDELAERLEAAFRRERRQSERRAG
jgi:hypothetical protein